MLEVSGKTIELTAIEYHMVELLFKNLNRVLNRNQFLDHLYTYDADITDRVVDVHIGKIRSKIKKYSDVKYIDTVYGLGYKLVGEVDE
jgi:DNA-binding response OmpR family regulator